MVASILQLSVDPCTYACKINIINNLETSSISNVVRYYEMSNLNNLSLKITGFPTESSVSPS